RHGCTEGDLGRHSDANLRRMEPVSSAHGYSPACAIRPKAPVLMNRLAVFARWPEPGKVKTRLSPALTPAAACDLHRAMVADALAVAAAGPADQRTLWWADAPPDRAGFAPPAGFEVRDQGAGDLGDRLGRAFDALLAAPGDHAVVIGTDCPDLGVRHIAAAF